MNSLPMELGPIGIWTAQLDYQPAAKAKRGYFSAPPAE